MSRSGDGDGAGPYGFPPTRWTAVERAAALGIGGRADFTAFLLRYWGPLRAHLLHRWRLDADRADELLQAFVAEKVLDHQLVGAAAPAKGRFRAFLQMALDRFVSNQLRNARRRRAHEADGGTNGELVRAEDVVAPGPTPSGAFEVAWAREVLGETARRMRAECDDAGRADVWGVFEARVLLPALEGGEPVPYEALVARYGLAGVDAASNLVVTGKRMFARSLRGVIGEYVGEGGDVEQEIAELRAALARAHG